MVTEAPLHLPSKVQPSRCPLAADREL